MCEPPASSSGAHDTSPRRAIGVTPTRHHPIDRQHNDTTPEHAPTRSGRTPTPTHRRRRGGCGHPWPWPTAAHRSLLSINMSQEPFDDPLVRQALNYAIDKEEILEGAYSGVGEVAHTILPEGHWAYPDDLDPRPTHDRDQARERLEESRGRLQLHARQPAGQQLGAQRGGRPGPGSRRSAWRRRSRRPRSRRSPPASTRTRTSRSPTPPGRGGLMFRPEGDFNAGDVEVRGLEEDLQRRRLGGGSRRSGGGAAGGGLTAPSRPMPPNSPVGHASVNTGALELPPIMACAPSP